MLCKMRQQSHLNPSELDQLYRALAPGWPSAMATAVPVKGKQIILTATNAWQQKIGAKGVIIGRNPYSAPNLQVVPQDQLLYADWLTQLGAIQ